MDRFIAPFQLSPYKKFCNLKSNMDRFIDRKIRQSGGYVYHLKSNMDRFIDFPLLIPYAKEMSFKIQYG